jgi:hypothetical protein
VAAGRASSRELFLELAGEIVDNAEHGYARSRIQGNEDTYDMLLAGGERARGDGFAGGGGFVPVHSPGFSWSPERGG